MHPTPHQLETRSLGHRLLRRAWPALLLGFCCLEVFAADRAPVGTAPAGAAVESALTLGRQRSQHLAQLGVDRWHALGCSGRGVKVAILDSGFRGYRAHLGRALPACVQVQSFRADGDLEARDSPHGILCAEVVHALAPGADVLLANWDPDRPEHFLRAVRWAREQGARVISCSVIMPTWSDGEGGGAIHHTLSHILGSGDAAGDVLCFASAGNTAHRHWSGPFRAGAAGFHEWRPGMPDNVLTPCGDERVSVELCWQAGASYDLFVYDRATAREVGRCLASRDPERASASVRFHPQPGQTYGVRVRLAHGQPGRFHLVVLGGGLSCATAQGSIPFPADGPEVVAVGAVDGTGRRVSYSSCGPNSAWPKPDFVAPVPFPSLWRPKPFVGTSAAAPQAAAVAALLWARHPEWTANQVRQALRTAARDLNTPGHDCETGYGLVRLP
jgi:subtilisin family serine protease